MVDYFVQWYNLLVGEELGELCVWHLLLLLLAMTKTHTTNHPKPSAPNPAGF